MGDMADYVNDPANSDPGWHEHRRDKTYYKEDGSKLPRNIQSAGPGKPTGPGPCPACGALTVERSGKFGKFYGCSRFPECKGSRDREKEGS